MSRWLSRQSHARYEVVIVDRADLERYGVELAKVEWRATDTDRERAQRLADGYRRNLARRGQGRTKVVIVRPLGSSRDRPRRR